MTVPSAAREAVRRDIHGDLNARVVIESTFARAIAGFPVAQRAAQNLLIADHEQRGSHAHDGLHELWDSMGGAEQGHFGVSCPLCEMHVAGLPVGNPLHDLRSFSRALLYRHSMHEVTGAPWEDIDYYVKQSETHYVGGSKPSEYFEFAPYAWRIGGIYPFEYGTTIVRTVRPWNARQFMRTGW